MGEEAKMELPELPVSLNEYIPYLQQQSRDDILVGKTLEPFQTYESKLREVFAQEPDNPTLSDQHINIVPLFAGHEDKLMVKARDLQEEPPEKREKYILPLSSKLRREHGSPAIVQSLEKFKNNFKVFSESSLVDLDWSNVVAAGSAVTTCLLPVPEKYGSSKKALRTYYHRMIAPASDVDLFIYGLDEDQAIEKMKQVETCISNSILEETTTIRAKNAVTIVSKYPTRHVQIVLRLYKSMSEIVTGFDVDCSCALFDGSQVWASPRAVTSFVTQANTIDLTRRSPSYENRLAKYGHRGFEVHWSELDRSKVDPTIFERAFNHVVGLARLLVMEKLPTSEARDHYITNRREERNRPPRRTPHYSRRQLSANLKSTQPEDIAEWVYDEDVSNYHTFTIPYGPKYTARKLEKLLYQKDLLLNAEWNRPDDREVSLHRHPAFFGNMEHVVEDCCGFCPSPVTEEEISLAEEESKKYISGRIKFIKDNPGRQTIGSFNPITDTEWTEMAYVSDTARLCQAIVEEDLQAVKKCSAQEGFDVDSRDYSGRMPLHLAVMCSTPAIVQCLIDHDARLISRVAGGYTSLHLAAVRGNVEIVEAILTKSEANRASHFEKQQKTIPLHSAQEPSSDNDDSSSVPGCDGDNDITVIDAESDIRHVTTQGSIININSPTEEFDNEKEGEEGDPNFYDTIDVLSWDNPITPLQLAIIMGHSSIVRALGDRGADILRPIIHKLIYSYNEKQAVLPMTLALCHPPKTSMELMETLLEFGALSSQADHHHITSFHLTVFMGEPEFLDALFRIDAPAAQIAIDYPAIVKTYSGPRKVQLPLSTAIKYRDLPMVMKLLELGANISPSKERIGRFCARQEGRIEQPLEHPLILATANSSLEVVKALIDAGADPNAMTPSTYDLLGQDAHSLFFQNSTGNTALDVLDSRIMELKNRRNIDATESRIIPPPPDLESDLKFFSDLMKDTYEYWFVQNEIKISKWAVEVMKECRQRQLESLMGTKNKNKEQKELVQNDISILEDLRRYLVDKGAKTFVDLYPPPEGKVNPPTGQRTVVYPKNEETLFSVTPKFWSLDTNIAKLDNSSQYLQLFQAVWDNNVEEVKKLTLGSPGAIKENLPLQVAVKDQRQLTPFTIATIRGHFELASVILEIAQAQYLPKSNPSGRKEYDIVVDVYSDDESDRSTNDVCIDTQYELGNEHYTIDDIREVASIVKSTTSPLMLLTHECNLNLQLDDEEKHVKRLQKEATNSFFGFYTAKGVYKSLCGMDGSPKTLDMLEYAIRKGDIGMVEFVIQQHGNWTEYSAEEEESGEEGSSKRFIELGAWTPYSGVAMNLGKIEILGFLFATTGIELPFRALTEKVETDAVVKPKYYQGLSVYGSKRKDWAENRVVGHFRYENQSSLLLRSIESRNRDSIEWFLSDEPERKYTEFITTYQHDPRLKALYNAEEGFQNIISEWIYKNRELAIHHAIQKSPDEELDYSLVEFVVNRVPESLNAGDSNGLTPLILSVSLRDTRAMRILIEAGADQEARDVYGYNVLHHLVIGRHEPASIQDLKDMADILNTEVITRLATQKSFVKDSGGMTPLVHWINYGKDITPETLKTLLEITGGQELYLMDNKGQYPIHLVVEKKNTDLARVMLEFDPNLAMLENATGVTPLDLCETLLFHMVYKHSAAIPGKIYADYPAQKLLNGGAKEVESRWNAFSPREFNLPYDHLPWWVGGNARTLVWDVVREYASKATAKRKLVSLYDANLFVRRIETNRWKPALEKDYDGNE